MARLTRRQFLALGAAGAAAASLPALARGSEKPWNARVSRPIRKYSESVTTSCDGCASHCSLVAYRQEGRTAAVIPQNGGCPRGALSFENLYDGERLTVPLKRLGHRGKGEWERISWEEAAALVASALRDSGGNAVAELGRADPLAGTLLPTVGFGTVATTEATREWFSRRARGELYGEEEGQVDLSAARTVLLWGANVVDGGADFARSVAELVKAKQSGALVVLVSPRAGATGSYVDRWLPVAPGFEAHTALALASLVAASSGDQALKERFGLDPAEIREALANAVATGNKFGGLAPEDTKWLAARFAAGPVAVRCDGAGLGDARALEAATAILNALGGSTKFRVAPKTGLEARTTASGDKVAASLVGGKRVGVYLAYRANPAFSAPQSQEVVKALKDEARAGLVVSFDTHLTETGVCADLILPAASDLECWNLHGGLCPNGAPGYLVAAPVQVWGGEAERLRAKETPLAELFDGPKAGAVAQAKQLGDFLLLVAKNLGRSIPAKSPAEAVAIAGANLGLREGAFWMAAPQKPSEWKADGAALLSMLRSVKPRRKLGGLTLLPVDYIEVDAAMPNSALSREIRPENPVYVNASAAKRLGLKRGATVTVKTDRGRVEGKVFPVQTLHPDAVAMAREYGHTAFGSVASAKAVENVAPKVKTTRKDFMRTAVGEVRKAVADPHGGEAHGPAGPGVNITVLAPLPGESEGAALWREIPVTLGKA